MDSLSWELLASLSQELLASFSQELLGRRGRGAFDNDGVPWMTQGVLVKLYVQRYVLKLYVQWYVVKLPVQMYVMVVSSTGAREEVHHGDLDEFVPHVRHSLGLLHRAMW